MKILINFLSLIFICCLSAAEDSQICPHQGQFGKINFNTTIDTLSGDPNQLVQLLNIIIVEVEEGEDANLGCKELCCKTDMCDASVLAPSLDNPKSFYCNLFQCSPIDRCHLTNGDGLVTTLLDRSKKTNDTEVGKRDPESSANKTITQTETTTLSASSSGQTDNQTTQTWPSFNGTTAKENENNNASSAQLSTNTWPENSLIKTESVNQRSTFAKKTTLSLGSTMQNKLTTQHSNSTTATKTATTLTSKQTTTELLSTHKVTRLSSMKSASEFTTKSLPVNSTTLSGKDKVNKKDKVKEEAQNGPRAAFLVTSLVIGVIFLIVTTIVVGKQMYERYQRRHYNPIDPLLNGGNPPTVEDKLTHDY